MSTRLLERHLAGRSAYLGQRGFMPKNADRTGACMVATWSVEWKN